MQIVETGNHDLIFRRRRTTAVTRHDFVDELAVLTFGEFGSRGIKPRVIKEFARGAGHGKTMMDVGRFGFGFVRMHFARGIPRVGPFQFVGEGEGIVGRIKRTGDSALAGGAAGEDNQQGEGRETKAMSEGGQRGLG